MSKAATFERSLGKSGIKVSPMGFGCWAIGGDFTFDGKPDGWGLVDDRESISAIHHALDAGINFFDTADAYGAGHSEIVLGNALKGRRDQAVISTKFGFTYNSETREVSGTDTSPAYARRACEASLRRLGTDYLDLYLLHVGSIPQPAAEDLAGALDDLCREGLVRSYGWSTWDPDCARLFASRPHCAAVEHTLNVFDDAPSMLDVCRQHNLASIDISPLAMGILTGKFTADSRLPADDVRGARHEWVAYFKEGRPEDAYLDRLEAIREILTSDGRTLAQGALAWIWARSDQTIPIPGFKNVRQAEENAGALALGPLTPQQMEEIEELLEREPVETTS
ncbi:aldo/keto reductase [Nonomuraea rhizosphaerae]|uniref:aldo/keto reductase n=1 Tax=Nonomuraea rhizosphaerae TaxID=2665663 RepID=UPI001C5D6F1D|nr:aldo/keto reductase [Nonomuraea rhizosphaerae]